VPLHPPAASARHAIGVALAVLLAACATGGAAAPRPGSAASNGDRAVALGDRVRQDRRLALDRFRPARPAVDSGGECVVLPSPTPGTRLLAAYFPTRAEPEVLVNLTVDSAGRVLRYHERRGLVTIPELARATAATADSVVAAAERRTRVTEISLDRVTDEARAVNRGGGQPSQGVFGTVAELETSQQLGRPGTRALRVVGLCGGG
jgi:hypothetical protein